MSNSENGEKKPSIIKIKRNELKTGDVTLKLNAGKKYTIVLVRPPFSPSR